MIFMGAVATERVTLTITSDPADLDLTTVTAVELRARKPNRPSTEYVVWDATILAQTDESLTIEHEFEEGDVPVPGDYVMHMVLTVPGGVRRTAGGVLQVAP